MLQEENEYILLEFPMGRANALISQYIDFAVYLDVPMDVLLARKVIRDYCQRSPHKRALADPLGALDGFLTDYLARLRVTVSNYVRVVKPCADLVIDGCQSVERMAEIIAREAGSRAILRPRALAKDKEHS